MLRNPTLPNIATILDGGSYSLTSRANGYDCHHLFSKHFCKKHPEIVTKYGAPSVLIPTSVYKNTGSYGNSKSAQHYRRLEEQAFQQGGLHEVMKLAIFDLINAF